MFVVDTNILIYAANADAAEHATCRAQLEAWRSRAGVWYLTWGICYEFLRVATHPRVLQRPLSARDAWHFLQSVLASPGASLLVPTDRHAAVLTELLERVPGLAGNLVHDATTVTLMYEHGIRRIYTHDADFYRFPDIEPLDPLAV
ncbi:MAG: TA system VapC family ribonuclease toxin [Gemmatimonadaceae bacterium]